jgi:predicted RNase H-like HicB family nuclease
MKAMRTYTIVVEPEEGGGYYVTAPRSQDASRVAARSKNASSAIEAIEVHIAGLQVDGKPIPEEIAAPQLLAVTVAA